MNSVLISFIAIVPIGILILLAFFSRRNFLTSAVLALVALLGTSIFVWQIAPTIMFASSIKGVFVALEIIAIIFGALLVLEVFKKMRGEDAAQQVFDKISPDYKVKVILIAWALVAFLEGISGFGTPAMIAAPILIAIGVAPITSVIVSLIGGSLPVVFGAAGLPITYGMAFVIGENLALEAASIIVILNIITAPLVVAAILFIASKEKNRWRDVRNNLAFIIFASLAVSVPSFVAFHLLGPELTSIVGGIGGMLIISLYAFAQNVLKKIKIPSLSIKNIVPFAPYIVVAILLAMTRFSEINLFLRESWTINIPDIFGTGISYILSPLLSPAVAFFAVAIGFFVYLFIRDKGDYKIEIVNNVVRKIIKPALVLVTILVFVQIMLNSGINNAGLPNMIVSAAYIFSGAGQAITVLIAPVIGALGAFVAGSATVSNLLFSSIQQTSALISGNKESIIMAMQGMGSSAGNVIAIHNILAALAIVGLGARAEKKVLKTNLSYLLIYLGFVGILGLIVTAIVV